MYPTRRVIHMSQVVQQLKKERERAQEGSPAHRRGAWRFGECQLEGSITPSHYVSRGSAENQSGAEAEPVRNRPDGLVVSQALH